MLYSHVPSKVLSAKLHIAQYFQGDYTTVSNRKNLCFHSWTPPSWFHVVYRLETGLQVLI